MYCSHDLAEKVFYVITEIIYLRMETKGLKIPLYYDIIISLIIICVGRYIMAVSYNKLWKKLIDLEMSRTDLRIKAGISTKTLAKLGKNENVNTDILVKICKALECNVNEIMDITDIAE